MLSSSSNDTAIQGFIPIEQKHMDKASILAIPFGSLGLGASWCGDQWPSNTYVHHLLFSVANLILMPSHEPFLQRGYQTVRYLWNDGGFTKSSNQELAEHFVARGCTRGHIHSGRER
eukprot:scpid27338/ scgid23023/ 